MIRVTPQESDLQLQWITAALTRELLGEGWYCDFHLYFVRFSTLLIQQILIEHLSCAAVLDVGCMGSDNLSLHECCCDPVRDHMSSHAGRAQLPQLCSRPPLCAHLLSDVW